MGPECRPPPRRGTGLAVALTNASRAETLRTTQFDTVVARWHHWFSRGR